MLSSITKLFKRSVTIQHHSESANLDVYGSDISKMEEIEVMGELQQRSRDEEEGTISQTNWLLFLPADTPIDTNDVVMVDGDSYEVIGDPWHAFNPRTGEHAHVEVSLRRTSGEETAG